MQRKYGGIAQLGERLNGIQEVSGSIPLISTIKALKTIGFQGFFRCAELFLSPRGTLLTHIWLLIWGVQRVYSVLHHLREGNDPAGTAVRIFGWMPVDGKGFGKAADGLLPDAVLHVEIMLRHIHICVSYDAFIATETPFEDFLKEW